MNVRQSLVADFETAELVQPCDGALNHPSSFAQAAAVRGVASCQVGLNTSSFEPVAQRLGIIRPICLDSIRLMTRSPARWPIILLF